MAQKNFFNKIYDLYTSDLSFTEFERLIKRDAPEIYAFYAGDLKKHYQGKNKIRGTLQFAKDLIVAFLLKMSPVRRLFYSMAVALYLYAFFYVDWFWANTGFIMLNLLIAFEMADKLNARVELDMAKKIQNSLMPEAPPALRNFDIACFTDTAKDVGGDYYDFIPTSSGGETLLVIGDISGKGMAAALYMVQVRALLHHLAVTPRQVHELITELNRNACRIFARDYFFTAVFAKLGSSNTITLCRAGHLPVLHYRTAAKQCVTVLPKGIGLGLTDKDIFEKTLQETEVACESGDVLLFYTDGVTESMNQFNQEYGEGRLTAAVTANAYRTAAQIQNAILRDVAAFCGDAQPHDDLTLIVVKVI